MRTMRNCIWLALVLCLWPGMVVAAESPEDELVAQIDQALASGTKFLVSRQDEDGAWRSSTYGLLKDGTSLTPLAAWSLASGDVGHDSRHRARTWMFNTFIREGQPIRINFEIQYPVYAAGLFVPMLQREEQQDALTAIKAWREFVLSLQLTDQSGWSRDDPRFGGWGYSHEPPHKLSADQILSPLDEPNVSATVFALEALVASDPQGNSIRDAQKSALIFISRCQNLRSQSETSNFRFNDGGFHFIQSDPVRNKPGIAGVDSRGETRFASYGSATADGVRALFLCGVDPSDDRVIAARRWLLTHFEDGAHPGAYPDDRSSLRPALDYYYAASVAQAFHSMAVANHESLGSSAWAKRLARRLVSRQRDDGSWSNPAVDVREDDPLVATPLALRTLQICREELRREHLENR